MTPSRRDFLKYTAGSALVIASSDLVGELLAQSPKGNPMTSSFKGFADIALGEAKNAGCSYADIRFTLSGHPADGGFCRHCGAELQVDVVSVITPPDGGIIGTPQTHCGACGKD